MSLVRINPGDVADADVIWGNFEDLNTRLGETSTALTSVTNNVNNIVNTTVNNINNTIETTLSVYQDVVQPKSSFDDDATTVTSGDCYIKSNSIVAFTPTGNVTFHLPTITDNTKFYQILVQIKRTSSYTVQYGTTRYFDGVAPVINKTGYWDLVYVYDSVGGFWCVMAIYKGGL